MKEKFVTETGIREVLEQLYEWMPFFKYGQGKIHFGEGLPKEENSVFSIGIGDNKVGFELCDDGDIYIIDINGQRVRLQTVLARGGGGVNISMAGYDDLVIEGEGENKEAYKIKEDDSVQMAIKKLDNRVGSGVIEKESHLYFPNIGKMGYIYKDMKSGQEYVWNSKDYVYNKITPDIIGGGNANGFI